jgi:hypothetical protein
VSRSFINDVHDYENNQTLERRVNGLCGNHDNMQYVLWFIFNRSNFMVESIFMAVLLGIIVLMILKGALHER